MKRLILGKQELLILLVDLSFSMYLDDDNHPVNKYQQVQSSVESLLERISITDKANHFLVSLVLFSERSWTVEFSSDNSLYHFAKDWINIHKLSDFFKGVNPPYEEARRKRIGATTSISGAFNEAKIICDSFFSDTNIAPENRKGVSIMLFSDGIENVSKDLISSLETTKVYIENLVKDKIIKTEDKENLGISTIAIGKDANDIVLKTISTPYTEKQRLHIKRLRTGDVEASSRVDPLKCFLKLDARNNFIDKRELDILRKFLYLVTGTPI